MDIDQMGGSTLQAMADAVENANIVLIAMSQKYKDSPNCRAGKLMLWKMPTLFSLLCHRNTKTVLTVEQVS